MNRRRFLSVLGMAAASAAASTLIPDDPERLLWIPGAKTIIDLGATKQVLPATDEELLSQATRTLLESPILNKLERQQLVRHGRSPIGAELDGPRTQHLVIGGRQGSGKYEFQDGNLVGVYTEKDMELLNRPMFPERDYRRAAVQNVRRGGYDINTDE